MCIRDSTNSDNSSYYDYSYLYNTAPSTLLKINSNKYPVSVDTFFSSTNALKPVSYTHLRAHETVLDLVCRLLLEKQKQNKKKKKTTNHHRPSYA